MATQVPTNRTGKQLPENENDRSPEELEINCLGIKIRTKSPGPKTILILVICLLFIIALVVLLPKIVVFRWFSG